MHKLVLRLSGKEAKWKLRNFNIPVLYCANKQVHGIKSRITEHGYQYMIDKKIMLPMLLSRKEI